jgi:hypothetical protein
MIALEAGLSARCQCVRSGLRAEAFTVGFGRSARRRWIFCSGPTGFFTDHLVYSNAGCRWRSRGGILVGPRRIRRPMKGSSGYRRTGQSGTPATFRAQGIPAAAFWVSSPIEQCFEPHLSYALHHSCPAHPSPPFRAALKPGRSRAAKSGQTTSQLHAGNFTLTRRRNAPFSRHALLCLRSGRSRGAARCMCRLYPRESRIGSPGAGTKLRCVYGGEPRRRRGLPADLPRASGKHRRSRRGVGAPVSQLPTPG